MLTAAVGAEAHLMRLVHIDAGTVLRAAVRKSPRVAKRWASNSREANISWYSAIIASLKNAPSVAAWQDRSDGQRSP